MVTPVTASFLPELGMTIGRSSVLGCSSVILVALKEKNSFTLLIIIIP